MRVRSIGIAAVFSLLIAPVGGAQVQLNPFSYTSNNGAGDSYRDDTYTGCPCGISAFLTGGIGQLADGIWTTNRFDVGYPNPNEWVGWNYNPAFVFHFSTMQSIDLVRVHVDHALIAGLAVPETVTIGEASGGFGSMINSQTYNVDWPDEGAGRYWLDFDVSAQNLNTANLAINMTRGNWVFIDEFEFYDSEIEAATPEPASMILMATGLLAAAGVARRRRR